jgi:DNA-binding LytR/AlgR family response regulator
VNKKTSSLDLAVDQCLRLTHRYLIPTNDIIYLESEWNYTNVYTSDNKKHISSFTLKILESRITEDDFLRINRGCLVNLKHITQITGLKRNGQALLSNGSILNISRRKFEIIKTRMTNTIQHS